VAVSFEADSRNAVGMQDYLLVHGRARIEEGVRRSCYIREALDR
jgi:hypothetical protein